MDILTTAVQAFLNGIFEGSVYAILGLGLTLMFGVMRILNLASGALVISAAFLSYWLLQLLGIDPYLSIPIVLVSFFALGICIAKGVVEVSMSSPQYQIVGTVMVTYGLALLIENIEVIAWKANYRALTPPAYLPTSISIAGVMINTIRLSSLIITVAVAVGFTFLLKTRFGTAMRACTQNREMAGVMGVNYQSISAITFGIAAALGGIAGVLYGLTELVNPYSGMMLTIKGLTVAVLGGLGSFYGALLAGFVLGLAESFGVLFVSAAYKDLIGFVILIVILLLSPGGLSRKEFYTPT